MQYTQSKNKFNLWLSWLYSGYIPSNYAVKSAAFSNYVTVFKRMSKLLFQVYEVLAELNEQSWCESLQPVQGIPGLLEMQNRFAIFTDL